MKTEIFFLEIFFFFYCQIFHQKTVLRFIDIRSHVKEKII